jgi:serine protease Do
MRFTLAALVLMAELFLSASLTRAKYERRTAIVDAVQKTRDGIVTLKVTSLGENGKRTVVGTGVVVDERGYLITNRHVIAHASKVMVTLSDKSTYPGSDLMEGETIIAVGNPYGYGNSVSTGIISALDREIKMPSGEVIRNLIQTDASLNPGSSGGPLLNINGEVIGINVALREGAQGISFALNADTVKQALRQHLSAQKVSRVSHGLECNEQVAPRGKERQKVVVQSSSGPAARAGLEKGDVIVKVGNVAISNRFDLERALWGYKAGEKVEVTLLRGGKPTQVSLPLTGTTASRVASVSATKWERGR